MFFFSFSQEIADLISCDPKEIIFTSGATESNNIAVKGVARFYKEKKNHVITTQTVSLQSCHRVFIIVITYKKKSYKLNLNFDSLFLN